MSVNSDSTSNAMAADASWVIACGACHQQVAAPASMRGQLVECPFCQHQFVVEHPPEAPAAPGRNSEIIQAELTSLEGQLKENVTQITELRGNVSRLNMELHRHSLRMKTLSERQAELQVGITSAKAELGQTT